MTVALAYHPSVQVTAAADLRPDALARFSQDFEATTFSSAEALCACPDVDVVYVATPHQFHAEHVIMAAEHGKHVVVEKPMAITIEDCDAMIAAVQRNNVRLVIGHTAGHNPAVKRARQIVASGELGKLGIVNVGAYTDFLYRARRPEELDTNRGGGIIFNQVPHQVDAVRLIGGGMVRTVRAATGIWDAERPTEGSYAAFLEFENGAAATLVYSGYDHFLSGEFRRSLEPADRQEPPPHGQARRRLREQTRERSEAQLVAESGYGSTRYDHVSGDLWQQELGHVIVSCERGDIRLVADGLIVYGDEGRRDVPVPVRQGGVRGRSDVIDEMLGAVTKDRPLVHDGRWGKATLAVCLAILQSGREHREVQVEHQVPTVDAGLG